MANSHSIGGINMDYRVIYNPLQPVFSIISVIGLWKILEDRGEKGWKALIPFYNTYVLGKTFNNTKGAKKMIFSGILVILSALLFFIAIALSTGSGAEIYVSDMTDMNAIIIQNQISSGSSFGVFGIFTIILLIASVIYFIVCHVKFYSAFDKANNGPSWMIVLWIFLPAAANIYYAFIQKNYNIPGISSKEEPQGEDPLNQ